MDDSGCMRGIAIFQQKPTGDTGTELDSSQMCTARSSTWPLILLVLSTTSPALADETVDAAVKRLSSVEHFAFSGVGFAGVISRGETDFKFALAQPKPTALNAFERLYAIANPQGKSYALSGLKTLAPERFAELRARLTKSTDEVEVMRGCIISHERLPEIARQIGQGQFRF